MNIKRFAANHFRVTLSERNLRTLLAKLEESNSARTLYRRTEEGMFLEIHAESDEVHYADREPGMVHPREEAKLVVKDGPFAGYLPCGCVNVQDEQRRCPQHRAA